ncbi:hypothetical protein OEZ86_014676 [Tetradesmus obliquus]|nr:hypothetical protein OEZ86_014676 [Tetradesmus obliquus]
MPPADDGPKSLLLKKGLYLSGQQQQDAGAKPVPGQAGAAATPKAAAVGAAASPGALKVVMPALARRLSGDVDAAARPLGTAKSATLQPPCSHADACKQPRHFTLSPAGVTAYFSDGTPAEFLTLDAFQREFLLHQQLMRLPLFRHFRRWKALSIWRKAVRGSKTSGSAEHLQKNLFGLNPVLQQAVLTVRRSSAASEAEGRPAVPALHLRRGPAAAAAAAVSAVEPIHMLSDSYALQAARRTEKRRLLGFIRLLDYMVADCVHSMIVASLQHALQCLQGHAAHTAAAVTEQAAGHEPFMESSPDVQQHHNPDGLLPIMLGEDYESLSHALEASLQQSLAAVEHYVAGFEPFREMTVANRQFSRQAVEAAVAAGQLGLEGLRGLLLAYQQQVEDVRNIPHVVSVGVLEVQLGQLVAALAPSPQHCLAELHQLLPCLAVSAYNTFISRVRSYRERLSQQPSTADEFVAHAALIAEVEAQRPAMDAEFDKVSAHYDLLEEFGVPAPEEEVAAARCMDVDYGALRDAAWAAEAAKDRQAQAFLAQLEQQTAALSMHGHASPRIGSHMFDLHIHLPTSATALQAFLAQLEQQTAALSMHGHTSPRIASRLPCAAGAADFCAVHARPCITAFLAQLEQQTAALSMHGHASPRIGSHMFDLHIHLPTSATALQAFLAQLEQQTAALSMHGHTSPRIASRMFQLHIPLQTSATALQAFLAQLEQQTAALSMHGHASPRIGSHMFDLHMPLQTSATALQAFLVQLEQQTAALSMHGHASPRIGSHMFDLHIPLQTSATALQAFLVQLEQQTAALSMHGHTSPRIASRMFQLHICLQTSATALQAFLAQLEQQTAALSMHGHASPRIGSHMFDLHIHLPTSATALQAFLAQLEQQTAALSMHGHTSPRIASRMFQLHIPLQTSATALQAFLAQLEQQTAALSMHGHASPRIGSHMFDLHIHLPTSATALQAFLAQLEQQTAALSMHGHTSPRIASRMFQLHIPLQTSATALQAFLAQLEQQTAALAQEVSKLRLVGQQEMFLQPTQGFNAAAGGAAGDVPAADKDLQAVIAATAELVAQVQAHQATAARLSSLAVQCGGTALVMDELEALAGDVELKHLLWTLQQQWGASTGAWLEAPFFELDVVDMTEQVERVSRQVHRLERGLPPNSLVPRLRDSVAQWQLRERHWTAVAELLGRQVDRSPGAATSITTLLDMQVLDHKERLAVISGEATQEAALEALLAQVADKWRAVEFSVRRFKDLKEVYILGEVDDVMQVLEDSKITMAMIQASRYVAGIKSEVDRLDKQLQLFSQTLEAWLVVQKGWLALEAVFAAPDIQRQVPAEAAAFAQVDRTYKDIMRRTHDRPAALQCGTTPGWLEALLVCGQTLEAVQKGLEDYLETKRVAFPRFYFLSNEELLDILRQAKVPQAVQPHLAKCFEGINRLEFGSSSSSSSSSSMGPAGGDAAAVIASSSGGTGGAAGGAAANDILAMLSVEGERVMFGRTLKARGLVESWLSSVESNMRLTLKAAAKKALRDYSSSRSPGWVLAQPAQLAVLVSNIHWGQDVEAALLTGPASAAQQLQQLQARCVLQLEELTELVRGPLSSLERKSVVALITTDVHNRDVVGSLLSSGVCSVSDFAWQMQLRFDYDTDTDSIMARQVNARFDYGYEYLGAQPRLVVTPMTDRCYITLTGALHLKLGGAPSGPAGTGKTETDHKVSAACSAAAGRLTVHGQVLAQCGAWACFDEFNRIGLEVLSVVAQQLLALQAALRASAERFLFEGREMALLPTCGVFITMNPGYAGRTELPDNLKVLFRPVAMVLPEYALVAQVMLFAEGFDAAPWLAGKMVTLYKLASEQLSQQKHYDFGMRALKAVLVMAGSLKRRSPNVAEEIVLIQAMRDANLPKLLSEDIILFEAILSDLFPYTQLTQPDQQQLTAALHSACGQLGLQPGPAFVAKAAQLHDTLGVRFGVMLVGPAGGGKTACYRCLQSTQTMLGRDQQQQQQQGSFFAARQSLQGLPDADAQQQASTPYQFQVHTHVLNPKSITLSELYGSYNPVTHDWSDGLASVLVRAAVADAFPDMHWVVFDGPVDAVWIENMNTVLDDNRMLCLPNGERIKLDEGRLRMLFEVEDLLYASPATVSRCGVVYVPSDVVGWKPFVQSWLNGFLARQHAAAQQPPAAEASRLPEQQQSTMTVNGCSSESALNSTSAHSKAATCSDTATASTSLQCPEELQGVQDFIWSLFEKFIEPLLQWVAAHGSTLLPVVPVAQLSAVTVLFETQAEALKAHALFDPALHERQQVLLQYLFAYAAVWGIGGCLASSCWDGWDKAVRAQFDGCANYPTGSRSVFDFYLDVAADGSSACFCLWEALVPSFKFQPAQPPHSIFVPTVDSCRYGSLLQGCMAAGQPVLLVGGTGVGKSAIVKARVDALHTVRGGRLDYAVLNCCAQTSSAAAQELLESNLVKRGSRLGPPAGRQLVLFVDDMNLPERQQYGAQPPLEMLRLLLDRGGLYDRGGLCDRKSMAWKNVIDTVVVGACGPAGGGRHEMSQRLSRHMLALAVPAASELAMSGICSAVLGGFLDAYFTPASELAMSGICSAVLGGFLDAYFTPASELAMSGICSAVLGGFLDVYFTPGDDAVLFGDFLKMGLARRERCYEQLPSMPKLAQLMERYLEEFNASRGKAGSAAMAEAAAAASGGRKGAGAAAAAVGGVGGGRMDLVFFRDAVMHVVRLARVLRHPRGSALLVGVGGSGKQSLARFAAMVADCDVASPNVRQGYGLAAFREDVKQLYRVSGVEGRHVVLLLTDSHIVDEAMLGDINGLLNTGEITGLFTSEEQALLLDQIRPWLAQQQDVGEGRRAAWEAFIGRARHHMHVVFATSPVGEAFRVRCRQFPSLVNCNTIIWCRQFPSLVNCTTIIWFSPWPPEVLLSGYLMCRQFPSLVNCTTIIWFSPWPPEALLGVGVKFLEQLSLSPGAMQLAAQPPSSSSNSSSSSRPATAKQPAAADGSDVAAAGSSAVDAGAGTQQQQSLVQRIAQLCVEVHKSIEAAAEQLYQEVKRRCYITPKLYLDLLQQYFTLLSSAKAELGGSRRRLLDGIAKLSETNAALDAMQAQLNGLRPLLVEKTASTSALLKQVRTEQEEAERVPGVVGAEEAEVRTEQEEAERVAGVVGAEEAEVAAKAAECQALKDDAAAELAAVLPALEAAVSALDSLNKADIIEMKTFIKPPALVQLTMEGVCILLQEKTDWDSAKRVLGDATFIDRLISYDKDNITERIRRELRRVVADPAFTPDQDNIKERIRRELRRVVADPAFTPDQVGKQSKAAMSMCLWVRAMDTYATVYRIVEPKRQILATAQAALDASNAILAEKQAQLKAIREKVAALQQQLADTQRELASLQFQSELASLQFQADLCGKRLGRAGKLTSLLGDELVRWGAAADALGGRLALLVGDALMAAAVVNYLGAFPGPSRAALVAQWYARCQELAIPVTTPAFSLSGILSTPLELLEWGCQGLPSDAVSVENALIATRGVRWPLMIDPQDQAYSWVRAKERALGLVVVRASDPGLLRQVEGAVQLGQPLLIEGMADGSLPAGMDALLLRQVEKQAGRSVVRLGERLVDYDPNFKLYMACRLANPHYLPEAYIRVNLVDFTVTRQGLEEQLLAELVRAERPELEESHDALITSIAADTRQLGDLESKILRLLREASGNLLDDESLISTLNTAKQTSGIIQSRVREAELTEAQLSQARDEYRGPPAVAAHLWFVVADLAALDPMYQASLAAFKGMYQHSIAAAPTAPTLEARLQALVLAADMGRKQQQQQQQQQEQQQQQAGAKFVHQRSWRGQQNKLTPFQKLLLIKVCREELLLPALRRHVTAHLGPSFADTPITSLSEIYLDSSPYTPIIFLLAQGADAIAELSRFAAAEQGRAVGRGLSVVSLGQGQGPVAEALVTMAMKSGDWVCLQNCHLAKSWMPQLAQLVERLEEAGRSPDTEQQLHPSFRLWLTSAPVDYFPAAVLQKGVRVALEPPRGLKPTLLRSYASLPAGCLASCNSCGRGQQWQRLVFVTALLHGLLQERRKFGALGWNVPYEFSHADLSCALQNIQGIVQDLSNDLEATPDSSSSSSSSSSVGPMGGSAWNALRYIVGQINYGGRMMDSNDLKVLGLQHLQPSVLGEQHKLTSKGDLLLVSPSGDDVASCLSQIRALPLTDDDPRLFGLHPNASIACSRKEARRFMDDVLAMQPRITAESVGDGSSSSSSSAAAGLSPRRPISAMASKSAAAAPAAAAAVPGGAASAEAVLAQRIAEMLEQLPGPLRREDSSVLHDPFAALPGGRVNSLGMVLLQEMDRVNPLGMVLQEMDRVNPLGMVLLQEMDRVNLLGMVLLQEMDRYNQLLAVVRGSLQELQAVTAGLQVLSAEAEASLNALANHQVPPAWLAAAYPSSKPLASWLADLARRVVCLRQWLTTGQPASFWLPGFFFPQGFLTGVLQAHARSSGTPIDRLAFGFAALSGAAGPADITAAPEVGVYVHGLYLEAARWDKAANCLAEPAPGEMCSQLPVLHLIPYDTADNELPASSTTAAAAGSRHAQRSTGSTAAAAAAAAAQARKLMQAGPHCEFPVYKTPGRASAGGLSTTGHSTNFLLHMSLPIPAGSTQQFWLLQGVAVLCSLDD